MKGKRFAFVLFVMSVVLSAIFFTGLGCEDPPPTSICGEGLRTIPTNPSARGPWAVGSKLVSISGLNTIVYYPATPGSEAGHSKDTIDMEEYVGDLPSDAPIHEIDAYEGLPLDIEYGPYPVIVFVHGMGSFRYASHRLFTHWASRGFVVLCADNPHVYITDMLDDPLGMVIADQVGDTESILSAVRAQSGGLSFLDGHLATDRIGLGGHSMGGQCVGGMGDENGVKVIITMASGGVDAGSNVETAMIMGGEDDSVATESSVTSAYDDTTVNLKRFVMIDDAGHMAFCDICEMVVNAEDYGIDLSLLEAIATDGCGPQYLDENLANEIVRYASTAQYEETLQCNDSSTGQLDQIESLYPITYNDSSTSGGGGCN